MLTADQFRTAAKALRREWPQDVTGAQVVAHGLAADFDREADASQGHATIETYHVALILDNDHGLYDQRRAIVAECIELAADPGSPSVSTVADALRDWCDDLCRLDDDGSNGGPAAFDSSLARELLGVALRGVDWQALARDYIEEAR